MKKIEIREKSITYCDYCKKEITDYSHTGVTLPDGTVLDLHSTYRENKRGKRIETCYQKDTKERLDKYKESDEYKASLTKQ